MPLLDDILAREQRVEEQRLAQADHAASWAQTFASTPPAEVLRAQRNVTDLVSQAMNRKMELAAQTDQKAQDIFITNAKFNEWKSQAPLRDEHLRSQIASEGATARFQAFKEAQTNQQAAQFFDGLMSKDTPKVGTPEYKRHVIGLLRDNPAFATTADGRTFLKTIAEEDDVATALNEIHAPEGTEMGSVTFGKTGGVQQATFRKTPGEEETKVPASALTELAKLNAARAGKEVWLKKESVPESRKVLETEIADIDAQIKGWNDTLGRKTAAPAAAPAPATAAPTIRKFNPQTGKIE